MIIFLSVIISLFSEASAKRKDIRIKEDRAQTRRVLPEEPSTSEQGCPAGSLLEVTFELEDTTDKLYANVQGFSSHVVADKDIFEYEMMWLEDNANANIDIESSSVQWRLRDDETMKDQHGFRNHCEHERLDGLAINKFMKRRFHLSSVSGKHLDTLLFSANPGIGKTATMLIKYIRIIRKNLIIHMWDSNSPPLKAVAYFPGKVTTKCKQSYALESTGGCKSDLDTSRKGWRDGKTTAIPLVVLSPVSCQFSVSFLEGTETGANAVELEGIELVTTVSSFLMKTPLYESTTLPSILLSSEEPPQDMNFNFILGNQKDIVCCSPLLLSLFNDSTLTVTLSFRDIHTDAETVIQLLSAPLKLLCDTFEEPEEQLIENSIDSQQESEQQVDETAASQVEAITDEQVDEKTAVSEVEALTDEQLDDKTAVSEVEALTDEQLDDKTAVSEVEAITDEQVDEKDNNRDTHLLVEKEPTNINENNVVSTKQPDTECDDELVTKTDSESSKVDDSPPQKVDKKSPNSQTDKEDDPSEEL